MENVLAILLLLVELWVKLNFVEPDLWNKRLEGR